MDGAGGFASTEADGEGSALYCSTQQRLEMKPHSAQATMTELNSSKLHSPKGCSLISKKKKLHKCEHSVNWIIQKDDTEGRDDRCQ